MKDNAISISCNDKYMPLCIILIMSLIERSNINFNCCDIIIFSDDISLEHKQIIKKIHNKVIIKRLYDIPIFILNHRLVKNSKWGAYNIHKIMNFKLLDYYDKVLSLDADMITVDKIDNLFDLTEDIAWRRIIASDPKKILEPLLNNENDQPSVPSGGLILLNKSINKYISSENFILEIFNNIKNLTLGGLDEQFFGFFSYYNKLLVKELDYSYNALPLYKKTINPKIIHFNGKERPWLDLNLYKIFPEWVYYYKKYIEYGGLKFLSFEEPKINYRSETYNIISNSEFYFNIIQHLNIEKISLSYNPHKNYLIFFLINFNEKVHYELTRSLYKTVFSIHLEDKNLLKKEENFIFFKNLYEKLIQIDEYVKVILVKRQNKINIDYLFSSDIEYISVVEKIKKFIEFTFNDIYCFFNNK